MEKTLSGIITEAYNIREKVFQYKYPRGVLEFIQIGPAKDSQYGNLREVSDPDAFEIRGISLSGRAKIDVPRSPC